MDCLAGRRGRPERPVPFAAAPRRDHRHRGRRRPGHEPSLPWAGHRGTLAVVSSAAVAIGSVTDSEYLGSARAPAPQQNDADYALPVNGDFVAAERHRFAGSVSLGMLGSPGCDLGTVTVLVNPAAPDGSSVTWMTQSSDRDIQPWNSSCGESGTSRPGRRPGPGSLPGSRSTTPPGGTRPAPWSPRWPGSWPAAGRRPREHEPAAARARPGRRLAAARRLDPVTSRVARASLSVAASPPLIAQASRSGRFRRRAAAPRRRPDRPP